MTLEKTNSKEESQMSVEKLEEAHAKGQLIEKLTFALLFSFIIIYNKIY